MMHRVDFDILQARVSECRRCPRLVQWREQVAIEKRAAYRTDDYWGRPVPSFGDPTASVLVVGLAPAAHGANRTGRMFTGDRSGDWLYRALYRAGFANQSTSIAAGDGLALTDLLVTATVRCAPPANKPTPDERNACRPWLEADIDSLSGLRVIVTLGAFAYQQTLRLLEDRDYPVPRPRPRFNHAAEVVLSESLTLIASYHPSQQNTFTRKLTEAMFDHVWRRARALLADEATADTR